MSYEEDTLVLERWRLQPKEHCGRSFPRAGQIE